jgi:pimeloyl-ACP methyl ester carboxylesterase
VTTESDRSAPEAEGSSSAPPAEASPRNPMSRAATTTGRALATAGIWVGRSAAAAYRAVDPDLRLHLAQLPLLGLTMLARGQASPAPLPDDGHRPVVFVHGLGGGPGNFLPMRLYFKLRGRSRTWAVAFPGARSLADMAARLTGFLEEVVTVNALPHDAQVDIVAHSMGGLAVRLALEDEKTRARVATLVTMATPHAGSHLARYGAMPNSLDLRPGSDVLARLARQLPWRGPPEQPRLVALWSAADVILLPARSAMVEGAENVELQGFTHYGYLLHPSGWRRVLEALDAE